MARTITPGTPRWLSANGFPGFGKDAAKIALERLTRFPGLSMHAAVFGGDELARAAAARSLCPATPHGDSTVDRDSDGVVTGWSASCSTCGQTFDVTP